MYYICRHIMPSGSKCDAPALRCKPFCYFHARLHRFSGAKASDPDGNLKLPILEDRSAIQHSLSRVLDALISSKLDARRAGLCLYALQIATQNVPRNSVCASSDPVEVVTQTSAGDLLGPREHVCEPPEDCVGCGGWETCEDYEPMKEKEKPQENAPEED
jgi:hypothetical protein